MGKNFDWSQLKNLENFNHKIPYTGAMWPDWAIYWTLANFLKPLATINLSKSPTFLGNFLKVLKSTICLQKSFLANFYRHLAIFFWSHCTGVNKKEKKGFQILPSLNVKYVRIPLLNLKRAAVGSCITYITPQAWSVFLNLWANNTLCLHVFVHYWVSNVY